MAITLQSFSSLLGKVNDGEIILRGQGDQATLERVNRGKSKLTQALVYKQVDLTHAAEDNLRTRQALRDALVGPQGESNQTYIRFVERALGLNGEGEVRYTPLSARVVKDLISGRDADRAATQGDDALRALFDKDGFTIVDQEGEAKTQEEHDFEELRNGLAGEAKEFDLSEPEEDPKTEAKPEAEVAVQPAEDKTAAEIARLKDELTQLKTTVRMTLKKAGADIVAGIKTKLAEGGVLQIPTEDGAKMVKLGTWEAFLVDRSLTKNAEDYFMSEIDDMLTLADENGSVLMDDFKDEDVPEEPKDIRVLKNRIDLLKGLEDESVRLRTAVGEKLETLVRVIQDAFEKSKTCTLGDGGFAKLMTGAGLSTDNEFVANLTFVFANIETKVQVLDTLEQTKAEFAGKAGIASNRSNEDPTLEQDVVAAFEKGAAAIREKVNGDVTKAHLDRMAADRAITDLREAIAKEFDPRIEKATRRHQTLQAFLAKTGVLTFVGNYKKKLSEQSVAKITAFYAEPSEEIKELLKKAVDAELDGTAGAKGYDVKFRTAFDAFFKGIEEQEIQDGLAEFKEREGDFRQLATDLLTPGSGHAIKHLDELTLTMKSEAEGGKGPMTDILLSVKEAAYRYGLDAVRNERPTRTDFLMDANAGSPLRRKFEDAVTDFVLRAHASMRRFDNLIEWDVFKKEAHALGMKHFRAHLFLSRAEQNTLDETIESLRKDYCLAGGADTKLDYTAYDIPYHIVKPDVLGRLAKKLGVTGA